MVRQPRAKGCCGLDSWGIYIYMSMYIYTSVIDIYIHTYIVSSIYIYLHYINIYTYHVHIGIYSIHISMCIYVYENVYMYT